MEAVKAFSQKRRLFLQKI